MLLASNLVLQMVAAVLPRSKNLRGAETCTAKRVFLQNVSSAGWASARAREQSGSARSMEASLLDCISLTKLFQRSFTIVAGAGCHCKLNAYNLKYLTASANTSVYVASVVVRRSGTQAEYRRQHRLIPHLTRLSAWLHHPKNSRTTSRQSRMPISRKDACSPARHRRHVCAFHRRNVDRGHALVDSFGVTVAQRHSGQKKGSRRVRWIR